MRIGVGQFKVFGEFVYLKKILSKLMRPADY